jgi:hypothetical protein
MAAASGIAVGSGMSPRARQIVAASGLAGYRPRGERLRQKKFVNAHRHSVHGHCRAYLRGNVLKKSAGTEGGK